MPHDPLRLAVLATLATLAAAPLGAQPLPDTPRTVPEMVDRLQQRAAPERGLRQPPAAPAPGTTARPGLPAVSILVRFATGSANLDAEAQRELQVLGQALASPALAGTRLRVEGHTDTVGAAAFNQTLSKLRAAAVCDFLERSFGLAPGRLEAVGLGESQLLVPTPDERAEPWNRRVQVVNLGRFQVVPISDPRP